MEQGVITQPPSRQPQLELVYTILFHVTPIIIFPPIYTAPTAPPDNLTVTSTSPISISIMWGVVPCAERNGELSRYQVRYNPTSDPSDEKFATEFNNDLNNTIVFTVIGLIPRTEYTIEVIPVETPLSQINDATHESSI